MPNTALGLLKSQDLGTGRRTASTRGGYGGEKVRGACGGEKVRDSARHVTPHVPPNGGMDAGVYSSNAAMLVVGLVLVTSGDT